MRENRRASKMKPDFNPWISLNSIKAWERYSKHDARFNKKYIYSLVVCLDGSLCLT